MAEIVDELAEFYIRSLARAKKSPSLKGEVESKIASYARSDD